MSSGLQTPKEKLFSGKNFLLEEENTSFLKKIYNDIEEKFFFVRVTSIDHFHSPQVAGTVVI